MASLYKRGNSPFWWIKCRDCKPASPTFGKTIRFSTGYRRGIGPETRKADQLEKELSLAETKTGTASDAEPWGTWVPGYLTVYCKTPATLTRYRTIWRNLSCYLAEQKVGLPRQLNRAHCLGYIDWRSHPDRRAGKYNACHNTAQMELKILSLIMREAVRREFAPWNPVHDLGIKRHPGREKPEFTDEHLTMIRTAIDAEPPGPIRTFLDRSFQIARYQGCRLKETLVDPQKDVEIEADGSKGSITFLIKGGHHHTAPLHPKLIPLFQELRRDGCTATYTRPPNPSRCWFDFMKRIGLRRKLPGACFHSLRVTAVTRLARSRQVSESKAMRIIGHASTTVHRGYQRFRSDDLADCMTALD